MISQRRGETEEHPEPTSRDFTRSSNPSDAPHVHPTSSEPIRFAYWVPNVSGGLVISKIPQRTSWDAAYNRKLAQIAEESGFDYALTQIRFTAGYGAEYQHESVAFSHALAAATTRLTVIAAILPDLEPDARAKQIATISELTEGASPSTSSRAGSRASSAPSASPGSTTTSATAARRNSCARFAESGPRTTSPSAATSTATRTTP